MKTKILCQGLFAITILNFFVFFVVATLIGGDAFNGKIEDGKYYVASKGTYTEVSKAVFTYSRCHVYSLFVTFAAGICAMAVWSRASKRAGKDKEYPHDP